MHQPVIFCVLAYTLRNLKKKISTFSTTYYIYSIAYITKVLYK